LTPSLAADRSVLIRRAYFDLLGLPPSPAQVKAFVDSDDPNAYVQLIDTLLDSPHYGERWGRHWLDVARYAEDQAHTFKARNYPRAYLYRDWVVEALNGDMPYDQFLKTQIAGDLMPGDDLHRRIPALGLFALGPVYYAEKVEKDKAAADEWDDRIDTLTRGVLGLTISCARCHDHKFDPITTVDYYGLAGIFASTQYKERAAVSPEVVQQRREADRRTQAKAQEIDSLLKTSARDWRSTATALIPKYWLAVVEFSKSEFRNSKGGKRKESLKALAKKQSLDEATLTRWVAFFIDKRNILDEERETYEKWFTAVKAGKPANDAADVPAGDPVAGELANELGTELAQLVDVRIPLRQDRFSRFGNNAAFVRDSDRAVVRPGVIPLGNLFDDSASVELNVAMSSDRFKAKATAESLGVDRTAQGWGDATSIAEGIQFEFGRLGADGQSFGAIVNDAWDASGGGISTTSKRAAGNLKRTEQGIGMHANALITFDLAEIRRAGKMSADQPFKFYVDRAGLNDDTFSNGSSSAHLAVIVSRPHRDKVTTDAIISAYVNGEKFENIGTNDFRYYFAGPIPKPLLADGTFATFDVSIPGDARYLTLASCGAGSPADA